MKCKYCGMENLHWPENYVKGCKPLENDTNIEHNWTRCKDIQKANNVPQQKKQPRRTIQPKSNILDEYYIYNFADFRNI